MNQVSICRCNEAIRMTLTTKIAATIFTASIMPLETCTYIYIRVRTYYIHANLCMSVVFFFCVCFSFFNLAIVVCLRFFTIEFIFTIVKFILQLRTTQQVTYIHILFESRLHRSDTFHINQILQSIQLKLLAK